MPNYFETNLAPLFAADFDYFRIPRQKWELMLTRLKQMGVNAVTVTVPWGYHEFQPGTIDLHGTTSARRDVMDLLNLCVRFDLPCLLKPGPYGHNGILGEGIPAWLLKEAEQLDEAMPAAVKSWYKALSKALLGRQWPDGPIIALQIDIEPAGGQQVVLTKQLTEVQWPIWLRKHYDGIEDLNAAYGATYRTVSEVDFPQTWRKASTPLEKDAKTFLDEVRSDKGSEYTQILTDAGWLIPIYPFAQDTSPDLPALHAHSLAASAPLPVLGQGKKIAVRRVILNLQHPLQVDPDPVEIGCGPVWAENAPIRADGSVRAKFWAVRRYLWGHTLAKITLADDCLNLVLKDDLLATCRGDTFLKIETTAGLKSAIYRLTFNGELVAADNLKVSRGKLSGLYVAEDEAGQTDLIFLLNNPSAPLSGFLLTYLSSLLVGQAQIITCCATLAKKLGQMLTPGQLSPTTAKTDRPALTSYTLAEARRGLKEADIALRKAMSSIGALEGGFATMLDREREVIPTPATNPVAISPEVFEGTAREILVEIGATCTEIAPPLQSAAKALQHTLKTPFTVAQYQQSYAAAIAATTAAQEILLKVIGQLRLQIASEQLPLVVWRVHDQAQAIAEGLRWGVLFK
ncbi:MAG: beta-galactosidase [Anaerolineae bacterium]|nr:beta-galactosidase [Anaerolineae bacterium]